MKILLILLGVCFVYSSYADRPPHIDPLLIKIHRLEGEIRKINPQFLDEHTVAAMARRHRSVREELRSQYKRVLEEAKVWKKMAFEFLKAEKKFSKAFSKTIKGGGADPVSQAELIRLEEEYGDAKSLYSAINTKIQTLDHSIEMRSPPSLRRLALDKKMYDRKTKLIYHEGGTYSASVGRAVEDAKKRSSPRSG
jgi:hypothetical protein